MRTAFDRVRHAVSFEIFALGLVTPIGVWAFGLGVEEIGIVALGSATIATAWNYVFNLGFDHLMVRWRASTRKTLIIRVIHAVLFEIGLVAVLAPLIAWYLAISLWEAVIMDVSFSLFYLVYAFAFNLAYDAIFPDGGSAKQATRL